MTAPKDRNTRKPLKGGPRSASRLAAVQALYQIELSGESAESVAKTFLVDRLDANVDGVVYNDPDLDFFQDLVTGTSANRPEIDAEISKALSADWPFDRLEAVVRAILRAGAYELRHRPDVPTRAVINEYLDVAHAFFEGAEPGFVNGVLDRLARDLRGGA